MSSFNTDQIINQTRHWVETFVIGLNLCPFAGKVFRENQIRYQVSLAETAEDLLTELNQELDHLLASPVYEVDTSLLIHPHILTNFLDYWDFIEIAEELLAEKELEGIVQIASFHPDYQFEGTEVDSPENFSNRSPYPMLHLLREESVDLAIEAHPDPEGIPDANIARLTELGETHLQQLREEVLRDRDR